MEKIFYFGERVDNFKIRVLNEREVRAGAGILFFFAMFSFLKVWLVGDFYATKVFVVIFLIDFFIRIFINPKYSPTLILGKFIVRNQKPEYVGAAQKRFAWAAGFILALTMFVLLSVNIVGPINLFVCFVCLLLLFFESAFGICLGCKIYNFINKEKADLCPGGVCEELKREETQKINSIQFMIIILFFGLIILISAVYKDTLNIPEDYDVDIVVESPITIQDEEKCSIPEWVVEIGHEEKWKLHHGCESE